LTQVDSILINDEPRARQVFVSEFDDNIITVEGIGSNHGLLQRYWFSD
jgi:hypothetical protein